MPGHSADVDLRSATRLTPAARPVRAVISLLAEAVILHFGSQTWGTVLDRVSALGFIRFDQYDDDDLVALLDAVPLPAEWSMDDRLRWLGCVAVPILAARYPEVFEEHRSPQSLLLALNEVLWPVGGIESGGPLSFEVATCPDGDLEIHYRSRRRLCSLTVGFVEGTASFFGYGVVINQPVCASAAGGESCLLECHFFLPADVDSGPSVEIVRDYETPALGQPPRQSSARRRTATRLQVTGVLITCLAGIFLAQQLMWRGEEPPQATWEYVFQALSVTWLIPLLPATLALAGMLLFPWGHEPGRQTPIDNEVSFRIVSRGENRLALFSTIARIRVEMTTQPLFRYRIEVVTDMPVSLPAGQDMVHFVVPPTYQTARQTLYKARALQYAVEHSDLPDEAWVVHLDEESQITASAVRGIRSAVEDEEATGRLRIGQGAILYHRDLLRHPVLTLADSLRTGDDVGRFYLQHRIGRTLFGLHGSFILARNSLVKEIGFDFGPEGSITEDSFWALLAMGRGYHSRWVDGFVEEQSTRSVMDFLRQRRRWFLGLILVIRYAPVAWRWRLVLCASVAVWALAWTGILYTYAHLFVGLRAPEVSRWLGNFSFSVYVVVYLVGLRINLDAQGRRRGIRRLGWYVAQVGLMPVFAVMEAAGVLYACTKPDFGFHVVRK